MYLNAVIPSLLLGTAFMSVQLATAQIQVNLYSDDDCATYAETVYVPTAVCSPTPWSAPNASFNSMKFVCNSTDNGNQLAFYGVVCEAAAAFFPYPCPNTTGSEVSISPCERGSIQTMEFYDLGWWQTTASEYPLFLQPLCRTLH